jgi:hypothetical protein
MKTAFVISSVIDIDNTHPLTYSKTRTHFSSEERLNQTIYSIASLDMLGKEDDTIFLLDASENYEKYKEVLKYQKNLVFVSIRDEFPEIYQTVRSHPNKSYCESLILFNFFKKYRTELEAYDFFFKLSGRYFLDGSFKSNILIEENLDKIFFKESLKFEWSDAWNYQMVDRRAIQGDNKLYQYSSVFHGWGRMNLDRMVDIYRVIIEITGHPSGAGYDVETLLHYFTRVYEENIIETDWKVYGWNGVTGIFVRY